MQEGNSIVVLGMSPFITPKCEPPASFRLMESHGAQKSQIEGVPIMTYEHDPEHDTFEWQPKPWDLENIWYIADEELMIDEHFCDQHDYPQPEVNIIGMFLLCWYDTVIHYFRKALR